MRLFARIIHNHGQEFIEIALPRHVIEVCIVAPLLDPGGRSDIVIDDTPDHDGITVRARDAHLVILPKSSNVAEIHAVPRGFILKP